MPPETPAPNTARPSEHVRDNRIERVVPLLSPDTLIEELPLGDGHTEVVIKGRHDVERVLDRTDRRLLVVVGPCSVHDPEATLDYAGRLAALAGELSDELLMAAEYILKEGNPNVMLCERGIRTFENAYRFTLDLMAVPVLKELTHLPVIVDPSHAAGRRDLVTPLSLAAAVVGADGIIVEVHPNPDEAICDGPQQLRADEFAAFARSVEQAAALAGRALAGREPLLAA